MYYKIAIEQAILGIKAKTLSTAEAMEACKCSKEGWLSRMRRYEIQPCKVEKARGPYGRFVWDITEVKKKLRSMEWLQSAIQKSQKP
jgi:hypothetical protein